MRRYPRNSPEAAARILALVLIADGQMCSSEIAVLKAMGAEHALGLEPHLLPHIVYTLSEELLAGGVKDGAFVGHIDDSALALLMAEISDPALQRTVLRLALAAARADGRLADGEALVVQAARQHWHLVDGDEPRARKPARFRER
jgi:tellurite resistance protein